MYEAARVALAVGAQDRAQVFEGEADDQTGEVPVHPLGPLRVAEVLALAGRRRGTALPVLPVDLDVPELGVGHEAAVGVGGRHGAYPIPC